MNEVVAFVSGVVLAAAAAYLLVRRTHRSASVAPPPQEADGERRRTQEILERMNDGVVVLDERLRPAFANAAARTLLGLPEASLPPRLPGEDLAMLAWRSLREGQSLEQTFELWFPARSSVRAHAAPLEDASGVVVVVQDVTQQLRTQRMRREFVSHASHELKSPVAGLQVLAESVRDAVSADPAAASDFAERIVRESDRLARLVADLLDLARLEEAEQVPETPVDLAAVVAAEVTAAAYAAER
ncbi:MAG TPA: histidine kinase dimerization/phospho-acceptor domain-containing protein, partial [Actinomycetota bacterium]|nr:histidine kinase dimerization/phospho-acceptor domain-containing protein [Actinomycetota bacterium]